MLNIILHTWQPGILLILLGSILGLSGCGEEGDGGISDRLSGPEAVSALPMRIDTTVTPTGTETPLEIGATPVWEATPETPDTFNSAGEEPKNDAEEEERDPSELETRLRLLTPSPEEVQEHITPTPSEELLKLSEETITPTPLILPTPSTEPTSTPETEPVAEAELQPSPTQNPQEASPENSHDSQDLTKENKKQAIPAETTPKDTRRKSPPQRVAGSNASDITLDKLVVCSALSNRTPSGIADQFSVSKVNKVYTWMKVSGARPPMLLKHRYYREGKFVTSISLKIKYPSMRSWSQKSFKGPESQGTWKVVVTTENENEILAEKEFTLVP